MLILQIFRSIGSSFIWLTGGLLFSKFFLSNFSNSLSANLPPQIKLFIGHCCLQWEKLELRSISLGQVPQWWFTSNCWSQLDVLCTRHSSSVPPTLEWEVALCLFVLHFIKGCPPVKQPRDQSFVALLIHRQCLFPRAFKCQKDGWGMSSADSNSVRAHAPL